MRGRHTYDVIAGEIEHVHSAFGLTHKVTACVTDNGSNFVKAFRMFEHVQPDGSDSNEELSDDEEMAFTDVAEALSTELGDFHCLCRCSLHTLNLISKNDLDKCLASNTECRCLQRCSFEVYSSLDKNQSIHCGLRPG